MSSILKGIINEVNPNNYDSDWDYQDALNRKPRSRPEPSGDEPEDHMADYYRKQDAAQAKYRKEVNVEHVNKEGVAPNGQRYNSAFIVRANDPYKGDNEIYKFNDVNWGAKKIVDTVKKNPDEAGEPYITIVYYVDNHKHGYWTPWKGEAPVSKGVQFNEELMREGISQEDLADVLLHRLELRYPDVVSRYEQELVRDCVLDVAGFHEGAEELGTSDISIMLRQVIRRLEDSAPAEQVNELSPDTLASYKKKAGADATAADRRGDYARGNKRMSGIVRATNKEFDNDAKSSGMAKTDDKLRAYYAQRKAEKQNVNEGILDHPALQGWDNMSPAKKADALKTAGFKTPFRPYTWSEKGDGQFTWDGWSGEELDDILHAARVKAANQADELNMSAADRRELQRQAKQDFEAQRQQLHKEKMEMERFAWEKTNTEAERKHEINKIEKEYLHDLRKLQMGHQQDMEKILHADTHELNKMKAEFNMRQAEREQVKPRPQQSQQAEPDDNNFDQDTGEPLKPGFTRPQQQSNQWHTNQQVGYSPTKPNKNNNVTDVEPKPPLQLGNSKPVDETKQRLDPKCWTGYKKQGTKMKGDTRVNNCVPVKKESAIMKGLVDENRQGDK